jgi:hypothetical protein
MPAGLVYSSDPHRAAANRAALRLLVPQNIGDIESLTDLRAWPHPEPPTFVNIACVAISDLELLEREAHELCSEVRERWPRLRPHVGLTQDESQLAIGLLHRDAFDVFCDLPSGHPLPVSPNQQPAPISYNPLERSRFLSSVEAYADMKLTPRGPRWPGRDSREPKGELCAIFDGVTPLTRHRLNALTDAVRYYWKDSKNLAYADTAGFGQDLENFLPRLDNVELACYLIVPDVIQPPCPRETLVQALEAWGREHGPDRVIYITQAEGDNRTYRLPNKRCFRCGSGIAVASLIYHMLK